jgi:hypothetical protein
MTLDIRPDLHRACQQISPLHPDYATRPIQEGFDWASSLADCPFDQLYLVVFRSVRRQAADLVMLCEHDDRAYEEARESGGLLRYFKGHANERGECLSFCLWETREQARRAADAASHRSAADVSARMYLSYSLERHWIRKLGEKLVFDRI